MGADDIFVRPVRKDTAMPASLTSLAPHSPLNVAITPALLAELLVFWIYFITSFFLALVPHEGPLVLVVPESCFGERVVVDGAVWMFFFNGCGAVWMFVFNG